METLLRAVSYSHIITPEGPREIVPRTRGGGGGGKEVGTELDRGRSGGRGRASKCRRQKFRRASILQLPLPQSTRTVNHKGKVQYATIMYPP